MLTPELVCHVIPHEAERNGHTIVRSLESDKLP